MPENLVLSLNPTDTRTFTGEAYSGLLASAEREIPVKLYFVRFKAGARTFWHVHSGPQILVVTSGRCRYQRHGMPVQEIEAGQSVRFDPGERHWHGAAEDEGTEHVAINLDPRETEWQEEVLL